VSDFAIDKFTLRQVKNPEHPWLVLVSDRRIRLTFAVLRSKSKAGIPDEPHTHLVKQRRCGLTDKACITATFRPLSWDVLNDRHITRLPRPIARYSCHGWPPNADKVLERFSRDWANPNSAVRRAKAYSPEYVRHRRHRAELELETGTYDPRQPPEAEEPKRQDE
jgi:hypothetical protein